MNSKGRKIGRLIVISGFSGVGKTSITKGLLQLNDNYIKSISVTTRKMRSGERNGVDYDFVSTEQFLEMEKDGKFLETTIYCGNHYGTPVDRVLALRESGRDVILIVEVHGAMRIKEIFPDAILIFLAEHYDRLEGRLRGRGENTEQEVLDRLSQTRGEAKFIEKYDYLVVNRDYNHALEMVHNIVRSEKCKASLQLDLVEEFLTLKS